MAAIAICCGTSAKATAQAEPPHPITWKATEVESKVEGKAIETAYEFRGMNTSGKVVKITKINKSCGCQTVEQSTDTLQPGDDITLKGNISLQPYRGIQLKQIAVETDSGKPQMLTVKVIAPEGVRVNPTALFWEANDTSEKEITVTIPPENESTLGEVKLLGKGFTFTEEKTATGKKIKVKATEPNRTAIRIEVTAKEGAFPHYVRLEKKFETSQPTAEPKKPEDQLLPGRNAKLQEAKILLIQAINKLIEAENAK